MEFDLLVLGIDPAPAKESVVFDGREFHSFFPKELKAYIQSHQEPLFISWDAPLSAALDDAYFSLTIRPIERFFNRLGRHAKEFGIPEGITTLGFSGCPHWTLSQYIFALPQLNDELQHKSGFELVMEHQTNLQNNKKYITEIHPALSMWMFLKEKLDNEVLFQNSWKYKGDRKKETLERRERLSAEMIFLAEEIFNLNDIVIRSDDELDAFVCWIMGKLYVMGNQRAYIYGSQKVGSFLLPYEKEVLETFTEYLQ
ncbi:MULTISPECIES: DUF429 domain-containing protein [Sulfurimonas]|uniref:DUF429 domain-containing protein n=1 Tax=Sulfurimonas TaxID=202746 RepID=UPI0012641AEF|nr:DUF429 domain-containing protein [Sulfurimonas indica]